LSAKVVEANTGLSSAKVMQKQKTIGETPISIGVMGKLLRLLHGRCTNLALVWLEGRMGNECCQYKFEFCFQRVSLLRRYLARFEISSSGGEANREITLSQTTSRQSG